MDSLGPVRQIEMQSFKKALDSSMEFFFWRYCSQGGFFFEPSVPSSWQDRSTKNAAETTGDFARTLKQFFSCCFGYFAAF